MQKIKTRPEYSFLSVRVLVPIYTLLCLLTVLFSKNFFMDTLQHGEMPGIFHLIVFSTIPVVLIIVLGISVFNLLSDFISKRPGSKFNAMLLAYFAVIVIFSIAPITLMSSTALNEIVRFWHTMETGAATRAANSLLADNYSLHLERCENIIKNADFSAIEHSNARLPNDILCVQTFNFTDGGWEEKFFTGSENFRLSSRSFAGVTVVGTAGSFTASAAESGFVTRQMPRDFAAIRYVQRISQSSVRLISYNLGADFDSGRAVLNNQTDKFETVNLLRKNIRPLLFYFYAVFFLPTLLMTAIIAISFTRRITHPIVELTEATRQVAEGDFSIQLLSRRDDELGTLIRSFNSMVQDLEKSREALVRSEKISIWQNMAQRLAHEVKNPLTPIKLSAERALRRWQNDPEHLGEIIESTMMAIIKETEGLSALLNEFRTLSKPMEPSNCSTALLEPVTEVINSYSSSYPNVKFDTENINADIHIKIDKNRLCQILTNLIINSIDAMDGEGMIEMRSDIVKKREVCYCRISVNDSGKGIDKADSNLIFTPYFTTKESGTGLGLPIIERIVTDHGGAIWFDSALGIGTTFYIDLPLTEET